MITPARTGLLLAAFAIVLKLIAFFYSIGDEDQGTYFALLHLLLILVAAFISISSSPRDVDWIEMFKTGMKAVGAYAVLFCLFLYIHYSYIDPMWIPERIDSIVSKYGVEQQKEVRKFFTSFASPFKYSTFTLMAFVVVGFFYTFLLTALERKVLRKLKR